MRSPRNLVCSGRMTWAFGGFSAVLVWAAWGAVRIGLSAGCGRRDRGRKLPSLSPRLTITSANLHPSSRGGCAGIPFGSR